MGMDAVLDEGVLGLRGAVGALRKGLSNGRGLREFALY